MDNDIKQYHEISFKPTWFHARVKLHFKTNEVIIVKGGKLTSITIENFNAVKYGVKGIRGYYFNIGRKYIFNIKNNALTSSFEIISMYRFRVHKKTQLFSDIIKSMYTYLLEPVASDYMEKYHNGEELLLNELRITQDGVFLRKEQYVTWENLGVKSYIEYHTLFPIDNPHSYQAFDHAQDWNSPLIYGVIRQFLKERGLWKEEDN